MGVVNMFSDAPPLVFNVVGLTVMGASLLYTTNEHHKLTTHEDEDDMSWTDTADSMIEEQKPSLEPTELRQYYCAVGDHNVDDVIWLEQTRLGCPACITKIAKTTEKDFGWKPRLWRVTPNGIAPANYDGEGNFIPAVVNPVTDTPPNVDIPLHKQFASNSPFKVVSRDNPQYPLECARCMRHYRVGAAGFYNTEEGFVCNDCHPSRKLGQSEATAKQKEGREERRRRMQELSLPAKDSDDVVYSDNFMRQAQQVCDEKNLIYPPELREWVKKQEREAKRTIPDGRALFVCTCSVCGVRDEGSPVAGGNASLNRNYKCSACLQQIIVPKSVAVRPGGVEFITAQTNAQRPITANDQDVCYVADTDTRWVWITGYGWTLSADQLHKTIKPIDPLQQAAEAIKHAQQVVSRQVIGGGNQNISRGAMKPGESMWVKGGNNVIIVEGDVYGGASIRVSGGNNVVTIRGRVRAGGEIKASGGNNTITYDAAEPGSQVSTTGGNETIIDKSAMRQRLTPKWSWG